MLEVKLYNDDEQAVDLVEKDDEDVFVAILSTGPLNYHLPEDMKDIEKFDLGLAEGFLAYEESERTIYKQDEAYQIPSGTYTVSISGIDKESEEKWSRSVTFMVASQLGAADYQFEALCCREDYAVPRI